MTRRAAHDVAIIGGGAIGSATAWHLLEAEPSLRVAIIEPDPGHGRSAASAASGGVRQLFSRPENVQMSRYTHEVIGAWSQWQPPDGTPEDREVPDLGWKPQGYLFVAEPRMADQLRSDFERQRALDADVRWLAPDDLAEQYPLIRTDDLGPAILSPRDGWLTPTAFVGGMLSRARRLGARLVRERASGFERTGRRLTGVALESGDIVRADAVVNAAGVWGPGLSEQLGLRLPVEPMRRFDHFVESPMDYSGYPFLKDPNGLAIRPEGRGINAARVDFASPGGWDLTIDKSWFEEQVWPQLVARVPHADQLRLVSTWAGHYDQNRLDGQMILDRWDSELDNYYFATGFSGHGLMHAPAVGRALTELILTGEFCAIDLSRMGLARVLAGERYAETTIR